MGNVAKTVLVGLVILVIGFLVLYNGFVHDRTEALGARSEVENQYQRRMDLIPNLVQIVERYAGHENSTLRAVTEARASATQMKVDASRATPEQLAQYEQAQGQLSAALGRLLMVTENYPNLKADQQFLGLQSQLEGTENRIAVARKNWINFTKNYNASIQYLPGSLVAYVGHFEAMPMFEAEAGANKAPKIKFTDTGKMETETASGN